MNDSCVAVRWTEKDLAGIIHDAANELMIVQAALALPETENERRVRQARQAADQACALLRRGLEMARGVTAPAERLLADEELADSLCLFRAAAGSGVTLEACLNAPRQSVCLCRASFHAIAVNLVSNASKALQGRGHIRLSTENVGDFWALTVADDGPGVPESRREAIFAEQSFFPAGHGLGLSRSRLTARQAGGDLLLLPGQEGAAFRLLLPAGE